MTLTDREGISFLVVSAICTEERGVIMKSLCNYNPIFFGTDGVNIMVIHDWDSFDVYYQIAGYPFIFAFGIPDNEGFYMARELAIANIDNYVEVLFK